MKFKSLLLPFVLAVFFLTGSLRAQNLFTNGDFESNTPTPNVFNCNVAPWGWSASSFPSAVQWENRWNSSWWIDLTDCNSTNGRWIEQTVPTIPGQEYYLHFDVGTNLWADAGVELYINGVYINRYVEPNDGVTDIRWGTFSHCFIASGSFTTFRFVASSTSGNTAIVAFDNAVLTTNSNLQLVAADSCAPSVLTMLNPPSSGTANWYFNGNLIASGTNTILGTAPGTYTLQFTTACGNVITQTVTLVDCCRNIGMTAEYFCLDDSTVFTFDPPPGCVDPACIGKVSIDFGDGTTTVVTGSPVRVAHKYPATGSYRVKYCWENKCTRKTICANFIVTIVKCGECKIVPDFKVSNCNPIQFTNTSSSNYHVLGTFWDFGDGSTFSGSNPSHLYAAPGAYYVCLTVITAGPGKTTCKTTICKWIQVTNCDDNPDGGKKRASTTGTQNYGSEKLYAPNIVVFPNPTKENVSISGIMFDQEPVVIYLYDITGRLLFQQTIQEASPETIFPTKDLEPGNYILRVKGQAYVKDIKLIKE